MSLNKRLIFVFLAQFDLHSVEIAGKKMELKSDESYLYWTPAPPKWDVTPAQVKKELFPKYHGAALAQDLEQTTVSRVYE